MSTQGTEQKAEVMVLHFENRPPMRARKDSIDELWLGYVYLDFGGRYIRWIPASKGGVHVWYRHNSHESDGRSYSTYLGRYEAADAERLRKVLVAEHPYQDTGYCDADQAGQVLRHALDIEYDEA